MIIEQYLARLEEALLAYENDDHTKQWLFYKAAQTLATLIREELAGKQQDCAL